MWVDLKNNKYSTIECFEGAYGFIYRIEHIKTGKFYIGKKQLIFDRKKKLGKKELIVIKEDRKANKVQGKLPTSKRVQEESDWKEYWGSSKTLQADIKKEGLQNFKRVIIQLAYNSKQLTYFETMYQISEDVLRKDNCWNDSILGKFHRKDFK